MQQPGAGAGPAARRAAQQDRHAVSTGREGTGAGPGTGAAPAPSWAAAAACPGRGDGKTKRGGVTRSRAEPLGRRPVPGGFARGARGAGQLPACPPCLLFEAFSKAKWSMSRGHHRRVLPCTPTAPRVAAGTCQCPCRGQRGLFPVLVAVAVCPLLRILSPSSSLPPGPVASLSFSLSLPASPPRAVFEQPVSSESWFAAVRTWFGNADSAALLPRLWRGHARPSGADATQLSFHASFLPPKSQMQLFQLFRLMADMLKELASFLFQKKKKCLSLISGQVRPQVSKAAGLVERKWCNGLACYWLELPYKGTSLSLLTQGSI